GPAVPVVVDAVRAGGVRALARQIVADRRLRVSRAVSIATVDEAVAVVGLAIGARVVNRLLKGRASGGLALPTDHDGLVVLAVLVVAVGVPVVVVVDSVRARSVGALP